MPPPHPPLSSPFYQPPGAHQAFTQHSGPKCSGGFLPHAEVGWQHAPSAWSPSLRRGSLQAWRPQPWHCRFGQAGHCFPGRTRAWAGHSAWQLGVSGDKQMPQALSGERDKLLNNLNANNYLSLFLVLGRLLCLISASTKSPMVQKQATVVEHPLNRTTNLWGP